MNGKRLIVGLFVGLIVPVGIQAATWTDDFSTTPFSSEFPRWCERWHEVTYNSSMDWIEARNGQSGDCSSSGGRYCRGTPSTCTSCPQHGCSNDAISGGGYAALTEDDRAGGARTATIDFRMSAHMGATNGDHISVWPIAHPNCHAGIQAVVARDEEAPGQNLYRLTIDYTDDNLNPDIGSGATSTNNCGAQSASNGAFGHVRGIPLALGGPTSTTMRYRLRGDTVVDPNNASQIIISAKLYDLTVSTTVPEWETGPITKPTPGWYNQQAKRFLIGSQRADTSNPNIFTDFSSEFGC